jgi:hypothetical protein
LKKLYHDLLITIAGGLLGATIALVPSLWQISVMNASLETQRQQVDIMSQSLVRKSDLVMIIPPDDFGISSYNGTVQISNLTLTLPKNQNYPFTIYISNVGEGFAHILYYAVFIITDTNHTSTSFHHMEPIVLKPSESTTINWTFIPTTTLLDSNYLNFTFIIGSAETTLNQTIKAYWESFP